MVWREHTVFREARRAETILYFGGCGKKVNEYSERANFISFSERVGHYRLNRTACLRRVNKRPSRLSKPPFHPHPGPAKDG
jgi:hypothetical protein